MKKSGLADSPFFIPAGQDNEKDATHPDQPEQMEQEEKAVPTKFQTPEVAESQSSVFPKLQGPKVRKSGSSGVADPPGPGVPKLQTYGLRNYDQLRRIDVRLTGDQKRFLDTFEEDIRQDMPELERDNPDHRRITKNSVIRVLVELVRQLDLTVDARQFRNEGDLLQALFAALFDKVTEFQTPEVPG